MLSLDDKAENSYIKTETEIHLQKLTEHNGFIWSTNPEHGVFTSEQEIDKYIELKADVLDKYLDTLGDARNA